MHGSISGMFCPDAPCMDNAFIVCAENATAGEVAGRVYKSIVTFFQKLWLPPFLPAAPKLNLQSVYHLDTYFVEYICQRNYSYSDGSAYSNISCQDGGAWGPLTDNCSGINFSKSTILSLVIVNSKCINLHLKGSNFEIAIFRNNMKLWKYFEKFQSKCEIGCRY